MNFTISTRYLAQLKVSALVGKGSLEAGQNFSLETDCLCILYIMRIIAGARKGAKLFSPRGQSSRPIIDRIKESLFSVLYKYNLPQGSRIADLFCGVGSLGLEALSRAAKFVTFVEKDPAIIVLLEKNIEKLGFAGKSKVIRSDAFKVGAVVDQGKYDLVFVDPPYSDTKQTGAGSALSRLLNLLAEQLTLDGIVVVRTHRDTFLLEEYGRLEIIERRQWGSMAVTILKGTRFTKIAKHDTGQSGK